MTQICENCLNAYNSPHDVAAAQPSATAAGVLQTRTDGII